MFCDGKLLAGFSGVKLSFLYRADHSIELCWENVPGVGKIVRRMICCGRENYGGANQNKT
jgi:hypothetical protein